MKENYIRERIKEYYGEDKIHNILVGEDLGNRQIPVIVMGDFPDEGGILEGNVGILDDFISASIVIRRENYRGIDEIPLDYYKVQ